MIQIDWLSLFDEIHPGTGATEDDIRHLIESVTRPISREETDEINTKHDQLTNLLLRATPNFPPLKWGDPATWKLPKGFLPPAYLDFLRVSNGGAFRKGEKWFDPVFRTDEIRGYLLGYDLPEHMPGVLPFAFDGSGTFFVFDMRLPPCSDEYPILVSHAGNLGFTDSRRFASSFLEACQMIAHPMSIRR